MPKIRFHHNCSCLKCNSIKPEMIALGCMYFCDKCFKQEFLPDLIYISDPNQTFPDSIPNDSNYQKWLKIYSMRF
jgi:hypothetical protein